MRFFDTDRWNEIWQTISRNRKRSIMTALGVFWGIFMLIVLLGAGMGLGRLFRAQLGGMSTNTKVSEKDAFFFCYAARLLSIFIFKTSLVFSIVSLREVILQK